MDPNTAQPAPPATNPQPNLRPVLLLLIFILLIGIIFAVFYFYRSYKKQPPQPPQTKQAIKPTPTPTPDLRLSQIKTAAGRVVLVGNDSITIQTETKEQTFNLKEVVEVGSTSAGKLSAGDLKVGQKVRITATENNAKLILIVK